MEEVGGEVRVVVEGGSRGREGGCGDGLDKVILAVTQITLGRVGSVSTDENHYIKFNYFF